MAPGGDRELARKALGEAIRLAMNDDLVLFEALRLRAGMHDRIEDHLVDLSKAIKVAPTNAALRRMRGDLYLRRNKWEEALADYDARGCENPLKPPTNR